MPPNSRQPRRHPKNAHHNSLWPVRISIDDFWTPKRNADISKVCRRSHLRPRLLFRLHSRHSRRTEAKQQHAEHLTHFQRFTEYGVVVNPIKCSFGQANVTFLGYRISPEDTKPPGDKIKAILEFKMLETIKELRRFLGMINFYRRFIPAAATIPAPLTRFLGGPNAKNNQKII